MPHPLFFAALLFAFITGANDGASLLATNLQSKAFSPLWALLILGLAVVVGPFLLGTAVASTIAAGLVSFTPSAAVPAVASSGALLLAVLVAVAVIFALGRAGLPSSVTQALTGAIVGAGLGLGLPVEWGNVAKVIVLLLAAPLVAGLLSFVLVRLIVLSGPHGELRAHLRRLHAGSFLAQSFAYAANDAQKMIAVTAVAVGALSARGIVLVSLPVQLTVGAFFVAGTIFGLNRLGGRLGSKLLPVHDQNSIAAGYAASLAVLGSAALGSPVSMAQSATTGLVAATVSTDGPRVVRWQQAGRIGATWLLTLPIALLVAAAAGLISRTF